jgi:hypothetical protein
VRRRARRGDLQSNQEALSALRHAAPRTATGP